MKKLKKGIAVVLACLMLLGGPTLDSSAACNHNGPVYSTLIKTKTITKYCPKHATNCRFKVNTYSVKCSKCGSYLRTTTQTVHECNHDGPTYATLVSSGMTTRYCSTHKKNCTFIVSTYDVKCSKCSIYLRTSTQTNHK